jgi:hypothetical protein
VLTAKNLLLGAPSIRTGEPSMRRKNIVLLKTLGVFAIMLFVV